ncbi:MAG: AMP-binding protein [Candidatus Thiodiazotropha sp.]
MTGGDEIFMGLTIQEIVASLPKRVSHKIWQWIEEIPEAIALQEAGRDWTYADLGTAIHAARQHLKEHQVRAGDRIMLVGENACVEVAFILAASDLDIWVAIINARLSGPELDAIRDDCQPRHIIYTVNVSRDANEHAVRHGAVFQQHPLWGEFAYSGTYNTDPEPLFEDPRDQVFAMIYTSGTTGKPKGVMLTHKNIAYTCTMSGIIRGVTRGQRVYAVLPMSHSFGLSVVCLATLYGGASVYLEPRFNPDTCLDTLLKQKINMFMGVPPIYSLLIEAIKTRGLRGDNLALEYISVGGAPLDPETKAATESFFGLVLHNGFGLTETSPSISTTRRNERLGNCSCGRPLPGTDIRLLKADGCEANTGEVGELWVRGPQVMKGYYRQPELTEKAINAQGWFNTEDLAQLDDAGNISIVGRTKEMIVRSGFNVYPAEVEAVLNAHPMITQSAVVGITHDGDEDVFAYIQAIPGKPISEDEIKAYCREKLTAYKCPSKIILMDTLPATNTGKLLKSHLSELAQRSLK